MRKGQIDLLTEQELSLLLYIVNILEPIQSPKIEFGIKELLWLKHEALIWKLNQHQPKLTDEGKKVFNNLMVKLNKSPLQESQEWEELQKLHDSEYLTQLELHYEYSTTTATTQSEFQF